MIATNFVSTKKQYDFFLYNIEKVYGYDLFRCAVGVFLTSGFLYVQDLNIVT